MRSDEVRSSTHTPALKEKVVDEERLAKACESQERGTQQAIRERFGCDHTHLLVGSVIELGARIDGSVCFRL